MYLGLFEEPLEVGPGVISGVEFPFGVFPYGGMPCSNLMQGGEPWSCLNLISQALLTPYRKVLPFGWGVCWGVVAGGGIG